MDRNCLECKGEAERAASYWNSTYEGLEMRKGMARVLDSFSERHRWVLGEKQPVKSPFTQNHQLEHP